MYSQAKLRWLNSILAERLHHNIQLDDSINDFIVIKIKGELSAIAIESNSIFIKAGHSSMPCTEWDLDGGEWARGLGTALPAPGYGDLESPLIN